MPIMLAWHTQEHRLFTMHYMRLCREDFAAFENRQTHRINANSPNARLRRNNKVHIFAVSAAAPPILFAASPPFGSMRHSCFSLPLYYLPPLPYRSFFVWRSVYFAAARHPRRFVSTSSSAGSAPSAPWLAMVSHRFPTAALL